MNNPNDVVQNKHLDALAARIANFLGGDNVDDVVVAEDPNAIKISIGDFRFQFTGVIDGLTLHENNFYAADDSSHSTPLGSVTQSVVNGKTKFVFNLTSDAIDVADGQTGTVSCGKLTPNVDFDFTITPETYPGGWKASKTKGDYIYNSDELYGHAYDETTDETTGKISYKYKPIEEYSQQFVITLGVDDLVTNGNIASVEVNLTRDDDGHIKTADVVLKEGSLPSSFDKDTEIAFKWTKDPDYTTDLTTSVTIDATYLENLAKSTDVPLSFVNTEGTYKFTAKAVTAGYVQNYKEVTGEGGTTTQTPTTVSFKKAAGGDEFTIDNLASGLVAVSNEDGSYSIYASTDAEKTNALGTISAPDDKGICTFTISSKNAINGFSSGAPETEFTITLSDTDAGHNVYTYKLALHESLTKANIPDDDKATFEADGTDKTKYTYTPGKTGWKFTKTSENSPEVGKNTTTYTYSPSTDVTDIAEFSITGLKEGLTNLALDLSTGAITATVDGVADTQIATYNLRTKSIYIHDNALPSADHDWLVTSDYGLRFADSHTQYSGTNADRISITDSNGEYTCTVTSSVDNHVLWPINYGSLAYRKSRLGKSFTVSGLRTDLGTLTYSTPEFKTTNNVVVAKMKDLTFVVNTDALPLNPDNTVIELTNNTDDFSLDVDDNIKRNFANEKFINTGAGNYIYSASGSTVGWFVDGGKIFYNDTELNGTTFTLTGLRTDLGALSFDEDGNIHAKNGGIVGKMIRNQIT